MSTACELSLLLSMIKPIFGRQIQAGGDDGVIRVTHDAEIVSQPDDRGTIGIGADKIGKCVNLWFRR